MRKTYRVVAAGIAALAAIAVVVPSVGPLFVPNGRGGLPSETIWLALMAFSLSASTTPAAAWLARKVGAIDIPGGRKIHKAPTPLLGGAAIYVGFAAVVLLRSSWSTELWGVFTGASIVFALGFLEDTKGVPATIRLVFQIAAVAVVIRSGVVLTFLPPTWWGVGGEVLLTVLWIVGITNAFNFLDGLDGLAAGSAAINAFFLGGAAVVTGQPGLALLSFALLAAATGFLPYNYKPHRRDASGEIFLGDSGSTFLGFTLACLAINGDWAEGSPKDLIVPVLIMAVPIFDMILITIMRVREGLVRNLTEWIVYTGRDHFHHRLLGLGMRKKETVAIIYLVNFCLGISASLLKGSGTVDAFLVLGQVTIIFGIIGYAMVVMRKRGVTPPLVHQEPREVIYEEQIDRR
jgi:UDP-GlcNAc:undecaprenyl-phosphate GlcNAc-1-phosphate transferase